MSLVDALANSLYVGLSIWDHHEKYKYIDEWMAIQKEQYAERAKPDPDMAVLVQLQFRLVLLSNSFVLAASGGKSPPTPGQGAGAVPG